ncbi:hypothetical protein Acr_27g0007450 [Actinidia rufa]|uniref:F-box domain-containing protein n=1 Tax=Actinidia rufa TaxID=165716 RepID=A0A7J0H7E9_9ERIC|nr:hypothetical protein Acr_27g0007450 [Actinidia rufa]
MAMEKLPEELLMEILSRLPVKHLLRFRSVSKYWFPLIQNPSFISLNHNRAQNNHCLLVKRLLHGGGVLSLAPNEDPINDLDISFMGDIRALQLLGPCNGVICLTRHGFHSAIVLCNPSMREFRVVPQPPSYEEYMNTGGYGFDCVTNGYKVVRFGITNPYEQYVEIYDLSTDSWREVDIVAPSDFVCNPLSCTSWNGDIYWYGFCYSGGQAIIGFSMTYEVFDEMPVPEGFDIWVMNGCGVEVSWTKIFTVGPLVGLDRPLGFRDNGEFFLDSGDGRMRSYNIGTREIKGVSSVWPSSIIGFTSSSIPREFSFSEEALNMKKK